MLQLAKVYSNAIESSSKGIVLSIVTIQKNSQRTLRRTLHSVLHQDTRDTIEHVIIDGTSTDQSLEIAHDYATKAAFPVAIYSQRDRGISDAFNRGVSAARGQWVWFVNSDDLLAAPDIVRHVLNLIRNAEQQKLRFIANPIACFDFEQQIDLGTMLPRPERIAKGMHLPHPGLIVQRSLFLDFGMFSESFSIAMDYEWTLRVLRRSKTHPEAILLGTKPIVVYSRGGVSSLAGVKVWRENMAAQLLQLGGFSPLLTFIESLARVFVRRVLRSLRSSHKPSQPLSAAWVQWFRLTDS